MRTMDSRTDAGRVRHDGGMARQRSGGASLFGMRAGARRTQPDRHVYTGAAAAFGRTVTLSVRHRDAGQARLAIEEALSEVQTVERLMSAHDPAGQVYRLNRDGILREPDQHLLVVLEHAHTLSRLTRGAFDITVQPLWETFRNAAGLPSRPARAQAQALVDWTQVQARRECVVLRRAGMAISLNGVARGYAADLALAAVRRRGIEHAALDIGELGMLGNVAATPRMIGLRDPRAADATVAVLRMDGRFVATSSDYAMPFTPDFLHHHIFDPVTGDSPTELASVTVLAPTGIEADGLSTAFMVMGARKAHALAAHLPGVDLLTVNKRGVVWKSAGFPTA
jgi:thiamine biosynthesis lipoprotein